MPLDTCTISSSFRAFFPTCVDDLDNDEIETGTFGLGFAYDQGRGEKSLWIDRRRYSSGGYLATLGPDLTTTLSTLSTLKNNNWIDQQTRIVVVQFSFFNPYLNSLSIGTLAFEFLPAGGCRPFSSFHTAFVDGYPRRHRAFHVTFEILLAFFVLILIGEHTAA